MNADRWQQIKDAVAAALERRGEARSAYLAQLEAADPDLHREVRELLASQPADSFLEPPSVAMNSPSSLVPGSRLGPYTVVAPLGQGGMGVVYRARDTKLGREVAIKVLPDSFAHDAERLARFEREARTLASLNHPNITAIYGLEEGPATATGQQVRALVMELVEGPTLAERLVSAPGSGIGDQGSGLPADEAIAIAKQIAEALEAAHEQGIVHRDLKPANVKVRPDGTVKVLDFGLAKAVEGVGSTQYAVGSESMSPTITTPAFAQGASAGQAMTQAGVILGTAAYMSPEQAKGRPADKRADIWAFGCVLYELLTGRRVRGEDVSETLASVLRAEVDWTALPADLPAGLRTFLARCLEKDPRQRLGDIHDMRLALDGAFEPVAPPHEVDARAAARMWRRPWATVAAGLLAGGLLTAIAAWAVWPSPDPRAVSRFSDDVPGGQFRAVGRPVMALSPDGRQVVYNTTGGLYVRAMEEPQARLIPGTESPAANPFFSPDGRELGYWEVGSARLMRVAVTGGAPVPIVSVSSPFGVSWEKDGTILVGQPEGIVRVAVAGDRSPELVIPAASGEQMAGPQLLPDGDSVLFSIAPGTGSAGAANRWDNANIVIESLRTGTRTVLPLKGSDARYLSTGHLVYAVGNILFGVAFDAGRLEIRGSAEPVVSGVARAGGATLAAYYGVSDDGTLAYVPASQSEMQFLWVDRSGRVSPIETIRRGEFMGPRLSPDGSRVLVFERGDAWVYELADGRATKITTDGAGFTYGAWDPSGTRIAISSARAGNDLDVWIFPIDRGDAPQLVADLEGDLHVDSWSRDGQVLAVHHHTSSGRTESLTIPVEPPSEPSTFLTDEFSPEGVVFSPDGRHAAYVSSESGQIEVYVRPSSGPGRQQPVSIGGGWEPIWAANGELFYRNPAGDEMMAVRIETTPALRIPTPVKIFDGLYFSGPSTRPDYDVTSDGQRFLMLGFAENAPQQAAPQIHFVLNWIEELKRLVPVE